VPKAAMSRDKNHQVQKKASASTETQASIEPDATETALEREE